MIMEERHVIGQTNHLSQTRRHLLERLLKSQRRVSLAVAEAAIPRRPPLGEIPLSFSQQQVWVHSQMVTAPIYNEPIAIYIKRPLDIRLLERCFLEILRHHEIWRTTFSTAAENPVQTVQAVPDRFPLRCIDLRSLDQSAREAEAARLAIESARKPFDLRLGPLLRAFLVRMDDAKYRLYMTFHQIIFDAFSAYRILLPQLSGLYESAANGEASVLPDPQLQYGDFAFWQRKIHTKGSWAQQLSFWRDTLSGELPVLQWPTERAGTSAEAYRGTTQRFSIKSEIIPALKAFCLQEGCSSYMALIASYAALMARYTGQEDIVLGTFSAGRTIAELEQLAGYFVNPLALRINLSGNPTFRELVSRVKRTVLDALTNQDIPFQEIVQELRLRTDRGRNPVFRIALSQQPLLPPIPPAWNLATEEVSNGGSKMDLIIVLDERDHIISGPITYNIDLFDASDITRMVEHWQVLLAGALADSNRTLSDLPVIAEAEMPQLQSNWNGPRLEYPRHLKLHQLIEAQVARTPEAVALKFEAREVSYRELNARANRLANYLSRLGVGPNVLVGVCVDRSDEMVVALLAVSKAGGAYLPLDPSYPNARLAFMVEDSGARVLIADTAYKHMWSDSTVRLVSLEEDSQSIRCESDENPEPSGGPEDLLYVIYTSGSTGVPKGVQVCHRAFMNLVSSVKAEPGIAEQDVVLALTTISFDIAAAELFIPLTVGARIVIGTRQTAVDPGEIARCIDLERVTILQATPASWRMLIDSGWQGKNGLKIISTGEALPRALADELIVRAASVWNMYGPTETTVWSTGARVCADPAPVVIGRPIANTQIYILDKNLQPMPPGAVGELYIGGDGLAHGYLNRPELTAERFLPNPFSSGSRMYKTGDLGRFRPDGAIECLGRVDHQVKIRGYRIELDEIATTIRQHDQIRDAVVVLREDTPANPVLVGYVVFRERDVPLNALRDFLKQKLPLYMVPEIVVLDRLPLTPNGKVDRKSLPAPHLDRLDEDDFKEPSNEIERLLARLWSDVLSPGRISVYDNFFDLGGNSLSAIRVLARLQNELGVRVTPTEVAFQSLGQLAEVCKERLAQ